MEGRPVKFADRVAKARVVTIAGKATEAGHFDGPMHQARFNGSMENMGMAVRDDGAVFVADEKNHCIRMIFNSQVSTVAGVCGAEGDADGAALGTARFNSPTGLALGADGALYICDTKNNCIKILKGGEVTTIGPSRAITSPISIAVSPKTGDIYVASKDPMKRSKIYVLTKNKGLGESHRLSTAANRRAASNNCAVGLGWVDDIFILENSAKGSNLKTKFYAQSELFDQLTQTPGATVLAVSPSEECVVYIGNCSKEPGSIYRFSRPTLTPLVRRRENERSLTGKSLDGRISRAQFTHVTGLALAPNGDLYVADAGKAIRVIRIGTQAAADSLPHGKKGEFDFSPALEGPKAMPTDLELKFGELTLHAHKWYIEARSPSLLQVNFDALPLNPSAAKAFILFLYTNALPQASSIDVDFDFAFLLYSVGFKDESNTVLLHYQDTTMTFDAVIQLYEHCILLDWRPGEQYCVKRLRDFGPKLPPINLSLPEATIRLYHRIITEKLDVPAAGSILRSIQRSLGILFSTREGADFEICIGEDHVQPCHSVFLSVRWPFFDQMLQAQMRESVSKKLVLSPDELEPWMIYALLLAIYGQSTAQTVAAWDVEKSIRFLAQTRMYVGDEDFDGDCAPAFQELVGVATNNAISCINNDNVIEIYRVARETELDEIASSAQAKLFSIAEIIVGNPEMMAELETLPDAAELLERFKHEVSKPAPQEQQQQPQQQTATLPWAQPAPWQQQQPARNYQLPDEVYYRTRDRCDVM